MMPISVSGLKGIPSAVSSSITRWQARRHSFTSHTLAIMGNMMAILPQALARYSARSWVRNISGWLRQMRMARRPRAEFSSLFRWKRPACLSAPMSKVRTMTRLPFMAKATRL